MGAKDKDGEKRFEKLRKKVEELDARLAKLEKAAKEAKKAKKVKTEDQTGKSAGDAPDAPSRDAEVVTESGDPIATESAPAAEIAADAPSSEEVENREDD